MVTKLDYGETEAIALAEELHAEWLIIDEMDGRTEAIRRGLRTVGTLGILREAHRAGLLDLAEALKRLQLAGFRMSQSLVQELLDSL